MLNHLFIKNTPMVGIDIGSHAIKAVLLSRAQQHYQLEAFAIELLEHQAIVAHDIRDIKAVTGALRRIRERIPVTVKDAVIAVSGYTTVNKEILLAENLTDTELEQQILFQAGSLFPFPLQESYFDFERMGTVTNNKQSVMLSVCRSSYIQPRLAALEAAGFIPRIVDIERNVLCEAAILCISQLAIPEAAAVAVIDIGHSLLTFCVVQQGRLLYHREQIFSGYEPIVSENSLPYSCGEAVFLQSQLLQQIRRNIQAYQQQAAFPPIQYLLFSGGAVLSETLCSALSEELNIPATIADPFASLLPAVKDCAVKAGQAAQLMIATGLAIRGFSSCHL